jgi:hypothetical protein
MERGSQERVPASQPERRATSNTLVLPFTIGMLVGSAVTGILAVAVGEGKRLLGLGDMVAGFANLLAEWLFVVAISVFLGCLLQLAILKITRLSAQFRILVRFASNSLVVAGTILASIATIVSCLMIDTGAHPEFPFYKGPVPLFPVFVVAIYMIAPLVLVKKAGGPGQAPIKADGNSRSSAASEP